MSETPLLKLRAADKIMDSAQDLFYRKGIRAVGVDEIVQNAGVTKPSLYRAFDSKDGLATAYLVDYQRCFWGRIEAARAQYADDPRVQVEAYFDGLAERAAEPSYRGCALTNAIVEYPDHEHPVRQEAAQMKQDVLHWLRQAAVAMNARDPDMLADGLILLMEGAYAGCQVFATPGPAARVGILARLLIRAVCDERPS